MLERKDCASPCRQPVSRYARVLAVVVSLAHISTAMGITIDHVTVDRVSVATKPSEIGRVLVSLSFDASLPTAPNVVHLDGTAAYQFINVFADFGSGPEWIVQNVVVFRAPGFTDDDGVLRQQSVFELPRGLTSCRDLRAYITDAAIDGEPPRSALATFGIASQAIGTAHQLLSGGGGRGTPTDVTPAPFDTPLQRSHYSGKRKGSRKNKVNDSQFGRMA